MESQYRQLEARIQALENNRGTRPTFFLQESGPVFERLAGECSKTHKAKTPHVVLFLVTVGGFSTRFPREYHHFATKNVGVRL